MATECRSLIEFCRAFEKHHGSHKARMARASVSPTRRPPCARFTPAAVDVVILLLAIGAVLALPCFRFAARSASLLLPLAFEAAGDVVSFAGLVVALVAVPAALEISGYQARKCGNPCCKGLHKAMDFDIQLESEECVRRLPPVPQYAFGDRSPAPGKDREELEAELKKMAPVNCRTVLIFQKPCGCPVGRMEVWGHKKVRRIMK